MTDDERSKMMQRIVGCFSRTADPDEIMHGDQMIDVLAMLIGLLLVGVPDEEREKAIKDTFQHIEDTVRLNENSPDRLVATIVN